MKKTDTDKIDFNFSEKTPDNFHILPSGQFSWIGAWFSLWHFHIETAIKRLPIVGHIARCVVERHRNRGENQSVLFINVAFLNQFATINGLIIGQEK